MTEKTERNNEVARLRVEDGMTLREIGEHFGLSKQRICQILRTSGIGGLAQSYKRNEERLYDFIVKYKMEHDGTAPSYEDIRANVGSLSSLGYAKMIRNRLIKQGRLKSEKGHYVTWASIEVTRSMWIPPMSVIEKTNEDTLAEIAINCEEVSMRCFTLLEKMVNEDLEEDENEHEGTA